MSVTIKLSRVPPSANKLFATNRRTGGRFKTADYKSWLLFSRAEIMMQRPTKAKGRVDILVRVPQSQVRASADISNRTKAAEDLIVSMGILTDDSKAFVRSAKAEWADIEQTEIVITEVTEAEAA